MGLPATPRSLFSPKWRSTGSRRSQGLLRAPSALGSWLGDRGGPSCHCPDPPARAGVAAVRLPALRPGQRWGLVNAGQCQPAAFSTVARAVNIDPRQGRSKLAGISELINVVLTIQ